MLFSARGLARTWPKAGPQVVAACLQKAATGRPGNSPRLATPDPRRRIAAPATTGTPSLAPDARPSPVRGCYTRESGPLRRPWTGVRPCTPASAPSCCSPSDPHPLNRGACDCPSSIVRRPQRPDGGSPQLPVHPVPKRAFLKLALSTAPPSSRARFVAGGPSQDWNQRSPPSACWRPLAAARLPRHCRLNSPSVPASDNPHLLYTSLTSGAGPENVALQGGPLGEPSLQGIHMPSALPAHC